MEEHSRRQLKMKRSIFWVALIVSASAAILPLDRSYKAAPFCNLEQCNLPDCRCMSTNTPGGLTKAQTPQVKIIQKIIHSSQHSIKK